MSRLRYGVRSVLFALATGTAFALVMNAAAGNDAATLGFVVSEFGYAAAEDPTECPDGTSQGYREIFAASAIAQRGSDETDDAYTRRLDRGGYGLATRNGESVCLNPALGERDTHFRVMTSTTVRAGGIDLDHQDSRVAGRTASSTCAHDDFRSTNGALGIDNQFLRVVSCGRVAHGYTGRARSSDGSSRPRGSGGMTVEMLTGSWGILLALRGVDDVRNDSDVTVDIYANADPIQLGPERRPLADVTYSPEADPRFRASAHGRIVNGVLTTDPVDMRFHSVLNGMMFERPLRDARLRLNVTEHSVEGYLAGYTPLEAMYDVEFGFRNGMRDGALAPQSLRISTGTGKASVLGYTCEGAYQALQSLADGHRDPHTGRCTTISTQYYLRAIPAFVTDLPRQE